MVDAYEYRYTRHFVADIGNVRTIEDAIPIFRKYMDNAEDEAMIALHISADGTVLSVQKVATGDSTSVMAPPKSIFRNAVRVNADGVMIGHNHPGIDGTPSSADKRTTAMIGKLGSELGIDLVGAAIISDNGWTDIIQVMRSEISEQPIVELLRGLVDSDRPN